VNPPLLLKGERIEVRGEISLSSTTEPSPYPLPCEGRGKDSRSKRAVTYSDFENHASTPESEAMTADELRSFQAPLKARYRERPETALVTLRAEGRVGENMTCKIETGKARVEAGLHPATGGDGQSACSADMLLEALVGCAGVTLSAVATALGISLRDATIRAEGDLDFRGTLGVSKDVPVGFKQIRLNFDLDTDATEEQIATLLRLTERYCVVYQTLSHPADISVLHRVISR
jgi:uncharacterized OsmC-like protein